MYWWWETKVLNFVENIHIIKDNLFEIPLIFDLIQSNLVEFKEMYSVFNMGHRMELYTDHKTAITIIDIAKSFDVDAKTIGYCEPSNTKKTYYKI